MHFGPVDLALYYNYPAEEAFQWGSCFAVLPTRLGPSCQLHSLFASQILALTNNVFRSYIKY